MQPPQPLVDVLESRLLLSDGALDIEFAGNGSFTDAHMTAIMDMAVQRDGKIVAVGYLNNAMGTNSNTIVGRFNKDGTVDASFGKDGRVTIDFGRRSVGRAVAIASDGDIIVAGGVTGGVGGPDVAVARLNSSGVLDDAFSDDGIVITDLGSTPTVGVDVGIDGKGRIVVGAHSDSDQGGGWSLVRYQSNGALDEGFGNGGVVNELGGTLNAIEVLGNGKVLAAGELDEACSGTPTCTASTAAIVRYTAGGLRDAAFGIGGAAVDSIQASGQEHVSFSDIALQGRKIVAVGLRQTQSAADVIAARFSGGGIRDNSFRATPRPLASERTVMRNSDVKVQVQPDDKVVIGFTSSTLVGRDQKFTVARLRSGGGLDDSFNPRGRLTSTSFVGGIVSIGDGVIIIGSRMTSAGGGTDVEDVASLRDGLANIDFDDQLSTLHALALQRQTGRIIVGGRAFDISPGNPELGLAAMAGLEGFEDVAGPDREAPRAILQTQHPEAEGTNTEFIVRYLDDRALNRRTIDNHDIVVSGPNGFRATAKLVRTSGSGDDIRALYRINAPGGTWNRADEGRYTITLKGHQIADKVGNFAPEKELGRFRVQFSPTP